jgi:hypothetical protein
MGEQMRIVRQGSAGPVLIDTDYAIREIDWRLGEIETSVVNQTLASLEQVESARNRSACDASFRGYTDLVLIPYSNLGIASRAARFATGTFIPRVLTLEERLGREFHKGALFYNSGLAHLVIGDEDSFDYLLAMADEEDFRTCQLEGQNHERGSSNLRSGALRGQTAVFRMRFLTDLLNGIATSQTVTFEHLFGAPATLENVERWQSTIDPFHHYELFRFISELATFSGVLGPRYAPVLDNPYVMLRLGKVLAHVAQWVESDLTQLQGAANGQTLASKLNTDDDFDSLKLLAGGNAHFAGGMAGLNVNTELERLRDEIVSENSVDERQWRVLRVLYIVRNSTAHVIDPAIVFHQSRPVLLGLIQIVILSLFVIRRRKNSPCV